MQKVAIVGLPNAGKSTLFNRLTKRKSALVSNIANLTRDRKEAHVNFCGLQFTAVDTGGVDSGDEIQALVKEQVHITLQQADLVLFVVDAKRGTDLHNLALAKWIRKVTEKPVVFVVNKCESSKHDGYLDDIAYLNFTGPVYISAEHNLGMTDLYEAMSQFIEQEEDLDQSSKESQIKKTITLSIIGQPNVGKSTFVNSILGEKRVITNSIAGTTRDAIVTEYMYKGIKILLTDTAGMRRKSKVVDTMETLSVQSAVSGIMRSSIVILMVDFTLGISQQDLSIADIAIKNGKGIVLALNKSDLVTDEALQADVLRAVREYCKIDFEVPILKISALNGIGCTAVLDKAIRLHNIASSRISTAKLNKWLAAAVDHHQPPLQDNRKVKLKYISQVYTLPPTFVIATNTAHMEYTYQKYLKNSFAEHFSMQGIPLRMIFKKGTNPYT